MTSEMAVGQNQEKVWLTYLEGPEIGVGAPGHDPSPYN